MLAEALACGIRALTGVCVRYLDHRVFEGVNVYFANHTSHLDFLAIWAVLPREQRSRCVPVAAKDYWENGRLRRYLSSNVFHALLIDRTRVTAGQNPVHRMTDVLTEGSSLILFPEGTRNPDGEMRPFKSGLYHLAKQNQSVPFVPVRLDNLNRILPKGELLPVPLLSSVTFGRPMPMVPDEPKSAFLSRAHDAVRELCSYDD